MKLRLRRAFVIAGVAISLLVGLASIQVAAVLTAAAAPPPAPPVSLDTLKSALADEQARGVELQAQLAELNDLTARLSTALADTKDQVSTDGLSANELSARLTAAQGKLTDLKDLLLKAQARLRSLGVAIPNSGGSGGGSAGTGGSGGGSGIGGSGIGGSGGGSMSLSLLRVAGGVRLDWSACSVPGFAGYSIVRSTDPEIHFPPEDHDTEVARIGSASTTAMTDTAAPPATTTYEVYCLVNPDGQEFKVAAATPARQI
jgi:hypothetical protein